MDCSLIKKTIREINDSGSTSRAELRYLVQLKTQTTPLADTESVLAHALMESPSSIGRAERIGASVVANHGSGIYEVSVEYKHETAPDRKDTAHANDEVWRFECSSNRVLTYRAEELITVRKHEDAPESFAEPGLAVNWNGRSGTECEVSGVHVLVPEMREVCTRTYSPSHITNLFKRRIMEYTGCVNSARFHGWEPGEVLFLGAVQGDEFENRNGKDLTKVKFRFAIRPNRKNINADGFTGVDVDGWDYLWNIPWPEPGFHSYSAGAVVVSRLYRRADLTKLGIGR